MGRDNRTIAIVTAASPALGSGHLQRMTTLLWHLVEVSDLDAVVVAREVGPFFPDPLRPYLRASLPDRAALIIRDMRDSTEDDIEHLARRGPVLAIDDAGPGRALADCAIDLLPNPTTGASEPEAFIYGWGYVDSLRALAAEDASDIARDIDCAIYPGAFADEARIERLLGLMPAGATSAVLRGAGSFVFRTGAERRPVGSCPYARLLLSSRALLSHFGVALYEAHAAGCRPLALNPTAYHARLADLARTRLPVENLGVDGDDDDALLRRRIDAALAAPSPRAVSVHEAFDAVMSRLDAFARIVRTLAGTR